MPPHVTRLSEDSWKLLRAVRLAALAESPEAFGSTLSREVDYDEQRWRSWISDNAVFLALADGAPVGIVVGREEDAGAHLIAMWVDPAWRGQGVASPLVRSVLDWAGTAGHSHVTLWVVRGNDAAHALYRRHGFTETGVSQPRPRDPTRIEEEMTWEPTPSDAG